MTEKYDTIESFLKQELEDAIEAGNMSDAETFQRQLDNIDENVEQLEEVQIVRVPCRVCNGPVNVSTRVSLCSSCGGALDAKGHPTEWPNNYPVVEDKDSIWYGKSYEIGVAMDNIASRIV